MTPEHALTLLRKHKLVPVIRARDKGEALAATKALYHGGIRVFEITLTTPGAMDAITAARRQYGNDPEVLVGVGTVTSLVEARDAMSAGAQFVITPGLDRQIVEQVREHQIAMISGALTPTEVIAAWRAGAHAIKIFPCSNLGGASYLKALRAPFPHIPLIPTGGVNHENAQDFLNEGAIALGVGGNLVDMVQLRAEGPSALTTLAQKYRRAISWG